MSTNAYDNICRTLTSLEKSLDRLARIYFYDRSQYPAIVLALESAINELRAWVKYYRRYDRLNSFYGLLAQFIKDDWNDYW